MKKKKQKLCLLWLASHSNFAQRPWGWALPSRPESNFIQTLLLDQTCFFRVWTFFKIRHKFIPRVLELTFDWMYLLGHMCTARTADMLCFFLFVCFCFFSPWHRALAGGKPVWRPPVAATLQKQVRVSCAGRSCSKTADRTGFFDYEGLRKRHRFSGWVGPLPAGRLLPALCEHRAQWLRRLHARLREWHPGSPLRRSWRQPDRRLASDHHTSEGEAARAPVERVTFFFHPH